MSRLLSFILLIIVFSLVFFSCDDPLNPDPPKMQISHTTVNASWKGASDGSIDLTVTGGTGPYSFSWSNGAKTEDISGLVAGSYTCTVKDSNYTEKYTVSISEPSKYEIWKMATDYGDIYCWLYDETPLHKKNYLTLIRQGFFDSLIFHRVIKNFVIQGGDPTGTGSGGPGWEIPAEFESSLKHVYGAIGAARLGDAQNPERKSNGSQFYICQNVNGSPHLDNAYTVFGIVIDGMDAVNTIANVAVDANNRPLTNVYMKKVEILSYSSAELLSEFGFTVP